MERKEAIGKLKKLVGKELHELAHEYNATIYRNGRVNKGWAGHVTILKALGVLDPDGKPAARLDIVKAADLARLTAEDWDAERKKMIKTRKKCHSEKYARTELEKGDQMIKKADHLMAEAINVAADLYKDGALKKPEHYSYAYPDFLHFCQTGGSHIEQVLFRMYMKHRMRTYQWKKGDDLK